MRAGVKGPSGVAAAGIVAALIHALGVLDDLVQRAAQFRLRIAALVDRGAGVPEILHVDCAVIGAVEFRDHRVPSQMLAPTVMGAGDFVQRNHTARPCRQASPR